jgi:hypothetical protein
VEPVVEDEGSSEGSSGGTSEYTVITVSSYTRGGGQAVSRCSSDQDKSGALCYPKCRDGYYGDGPVCYASCPSGWEDQGLVCAAHSYAPSSCAIPCKTHKDWSITCGCPSNKPHNCASVCYENCRDGYSMPSSACGFCKADGSCPSGTTDVAGVCWKNSYGRGAGEPMKCAAGYEYDNGLCYPTCRSGYTGNAFVCWQDCPASNPYRSGMQCFKTEAYRNQEIFGIAIGTVLAVAIVASMVFSGGAAAGAAPAFIDAVVTAVAAVEEGAAWAGTATIVAVDSEVAVEAEALLIVALI